MEVRGRAAVSRDGELHQQNCEAHSQGDRTGGDSCRSASHSGRGSYGWRAALVTLLVALPLLGFDSRLVDANGNPVAGAQISVVDQTGGARTDLSGRFSIQPDPALPATLIVVGSRGELFPPIYIASLQSEVRLEAAYRETVTVTIGATPNIEGTPASAPVVVGREELEQRKPSHVVDAIASTPGVSIRGEGPPAVPVVRGLAGGRTLLLVDDARIVAERRAGPSATFLNPLSLGSIEVSRGPGSVAYGSDALGGVVHMRPRDPIPGQPEVRYDAFASFGGSVARAVAVEGSMDLLGGALLASVHARSADDGEDANGDTIVNSGYRDRGAMLRFVRDAEWGRMRIGVMSSIAKDVGAPTSDSVLTVYPEERANLLTFALDVPRTGFFNSAAFRASLGSYDITTNRIRTTGIESAEVNARDASVRVSGEHATERLRITSGVDFVTRFDLHAPGSIDDASRSDAGVYATIEQRVSKAVQLAGGGRVDYVRTRNDGGYFGDRSTNDTAFSGFAATTVGPFSGVTATLQIASGYREPTLSDRYFRGISGRGFVIGNPDLEPERSTQLDAGIRWSGARTRVALYGYDYRIRDLVERYRAGADFMFRNRGEATVRGLEFEATTRLLRDLELIGGASIARGEADGAPLDDIAPKTLHASLRWAADDRSAFVGASAYARDERPGPVETVRAGYVEMDAGIGWRFSPWFEVRVVVRNLTNAMHYGSADAVAAFAPGRSVTIGVNR